MPSDFWWGVVASVVPAAIAVVARLAWILHRDWDEIQDRRRSDEPDIAGSWTASYSEGGVQFTDDIELFQKGSQISGTIRTRPAEGQEAQHYKYSFNGTFRHLHLAAIYRSVDRRDYHQGAFVLRKVGRKLVGKYFMIDEESDSGEDTWEVVEYELTQPRS